jgi:hypothetical protein
MKRSGEINIYKKIKIKYISHAINFSICCATFPTLDLYAKK